MNPQQPHRYLHLYRRDGVLLMVTIETVFKTYSGRPFATELLLWTLPDGLTAEGELWNSGIINA